MSIHAKAIKSCKSQNDAVSPIPKYLRIKYGDFSLNSNNSDTVKTKLFC